MRIDEDVRPEPKPSSTPNGARSTASGGKEAIEQQAKHILWDELPSSEQFKQLPAARLTLINTMATLLMETNATLPQSRALLQDLFAAPADLRPDHREQRLHIHLHTAATPKGNRQLAHLLTQLNQTRTHYPGTDLEMTFHSADSAPP